VLGGDLKVLVALAAIVAIPARGLAVNVALRQVPDVLAARDQPAQIRELALLLSLVLRGPAEVILALLDVDVLVLGRVARGVVRPEVVDRALVGVDHRGDVVAAVVAMLLVVLLVGGFGDQILDLLKPI
jgi:hypothetical protein